MEKLLGENVQDQLADLDRAIKSLTIQLRPAAEMGMLEDDCVPEIISMRSKLSQLREQQRRLRGY